MSEIRFLPPDIWSGRGSETAELLLGAPLPLGALSARLVRLWVNPALDFQNSFTLVIVLYSLASL